MTKYFPDVQKSYKRCYETHPNLIFKEGMVVTGGSCVTPWDGYDIYVGLDWSASISPQSYPWVNGHEFVFAIKDHGVPKPKEVDDFKAMVIWLCNELQNGKKIHVGCIGGHGRTGLVFAAMYKVITGKTNAIQFVRKNYCDQAVESKEQVKFLMKHYNVDHASESKTYPITSVLPSSSYNTPAINTHYVDNTYYSGDNKHISNDGYFKTKDYDRLEVIPIEKGVKFKN